jgi:hypothetical protein
LLGIQLSGLGKSGLLQPGDDQLGFVLVGFLAVVRLTDDDVVQ